MGLEPDEIVRRGDGQQGRGEIQPFSPEIEDQLVRIFQNVLRRVSTTLPGFSALPVGLEHPPPTEEEEKLIKDFMGLMDEEIEKYAKDLICAELRDQILKRGPEAFPIIREALKKGKKPALKRKKGCIYLQFGSGSPEDPIEEILILRT